MSKKKIRILKQVLKEKTNSEIVSVQIASFDTDEIHFIPCGNDQKYRVFVPKEYAKMGNKSIRRNCEQAKYRSQRACVCC